MNTVRDPAVWWAWAVALATALVTVYWIATLAR